MAALFAVVLARVDALAEPAPVAAPAAAAPAPVSAAVVERLEWEISDNGARVIVAVKGIVDFESRSLRADPAIGHGPRAYVDLKPAHLGPEVTRVPIIVGEGLIDRIRIAQYAEETVRIVVDLLEPASVDVKTLNSPPRLSLDLKPTGEPRPMGERSSMRPREREAAMMRDPPVLRPARRQGRSVVVIDPGHGGRDPGARGIDGLPEKEVTLAIAHMLAAELEAQGIHAILTRTTDRYVPLAERTALANARGGDLFLSIHANASQDPLHGGIETYTLNNTGDHATIRLASIENGRSLPSADGEAPEGRDLAYILSELVQTGKEDESRVLAQAVQHDLIRYLGDRWPGVLGLGVKKGPFYVLVGAYMPCVLVEVAFLTNEVEGERIGTRGYQRDVAIGLAAGIRRFLGTPATRVEVSG